MPTLFPLTAKLFPKVSWDAAATTSVVEPGKVRLKDLRALGHKVERFLAARAACARHFAKALPDLPTSWVSSFPTAIGDLSGEGLFACAVLADDQGLHLAQPLLSAPLAEKLSLLWRRLNPSAPPAPSSILEIPPDANAPLWLALLRLRPLQSLWERELRRGTLESLLDLLPDAWLLDPEPLPPGAVIPRLEIPSWEDAPPHKSSRHFLISPASDLDAGTVIHSDHSEETWRSAVSSALAHFSREPRVLVELPAALDDGHPLLIAFYERKAGRVDGIGTLALVPGGNDALLPARVA
jgi:hypothetical protein